VLGDAVSGDKKYLEPWNLLKML